MSDTPRATASGQGSNPSRFQVALSRTRSVEPSCAMVSFSLSATAQKQADAVEWVEKPRTQLSKS